MNIQKRFIIFRTGLRHGLYNALCALETGNLREDNAASVVPLKVGLWEQAKTRNQEVISNVSLDPISGTRIIERFAPRPYYFASEDEDLLKEVDEAISIIKQV